MAPPYTKVEGALMNTLATSNIYTRSLFPHPKTHFEPFECLQCKVGAALGAKLSDVWQVIGLGAQKKSTKSWHPWMYDIRMFTI